MIHYADDWLTVHQGDCREVMAGMEPESVHCVVTSPPYWGLRDYGTATWPLGDTGCVHVAPKGSNKCRFCGEVRQDAQLGLEPTPELYVAAMVEVFRAVRRVLRADGTVWLNLGDSYYTSPAGNTTPSGISQATAKRAGRLAEYNTQPKTFPGLKPKDLVGIPWRVAFALQADGWYLRSDIIWAKPNPMPESVTDRPTKAHEYLFLLTKSARYFYDAEAVKEGADPAYEARYRRPFFAGVKEQSGNGRADGMSNTAELKEYSGLRNLRSVWTIATQPYPGAHFATFPEALVEPCVKAGCPEGGTVLDPFGGSGTTARVANRLSRKAVLIDLSTDYLDQAMVRNAQKVIGL